MMVQDNQMQNQKVSGGEIETLTKGRPPPIADTPGNRRRPTPPIPKA